MKIYISDILDKPQFNDLLVLVQQVEKLKTKTNLDYIKLTLSDKSGVLEGKIWDKAIGLCDKAEVGDIVKITGKVDSTYASKPQLIISSLSNTKSDAGIFSEISIDRSDFYKESKIPLEERKARTFKFIDMIKNDQLRDMLNDIFKDEKYKTYFTFPAAVSMHHAYVGGLSQHVLEMLDLGVYLSNKFDYVNLDIVLAGILMHDFAKIWEFEEVQQGVFKYSVLGNLHGHIFMGANFVKENAPKYGIDDETLIRLIHVVLSHHGKKEWGSPVAPKTLEARIVHRVDVMSEELRSIDDAIESRSQDIEKIQILEEYYYFGFVNNDSLELEKHQTEEEILEN